MSKIIIDNDKVYYEGKRIKRVVSIEYELKLKLKNGNNIILTPREGKKVIESGVFPLSKTAHEIVRREFSI